MELERPNPQNDDLHSTGDAPSKSQETPTRHHSGDSDCSTCTKPDWFGYVYPDQFGTINLDPLFWKASLRGTDSQAGFLIRAQATISSMAAPGTTHQARMHARNWPA
ncbi:M35 family metallo-endopeptidase [Streptomyces sp. NPDC059980]|uniref:M35 family metallo-endopeptidase n=1 Tax=Streptomyces sp. NPDC059980 TaxID=3347022 RepID=UPI00367EFBF7